MMKYVCTNPENDCGEATPENNMCCLSCDTSYCVARYQCDLTIHEGISKPEDCEFAKEVQKKCKLGF